MRARSATAIVCCVVIVCVGGATSEQPTSQVEIALPACVEEAPQPFIQWAADQAVRLTNAATVERRHELQALDRVVGGARVVGLGEAARRVQEFYELRHGTWRWLVEEHGFTALADYRVIPVHAWDAIAFVRTISPVRTVP